MDGVELNADPAEVLPENLRLPASQLGEPVVVRAVERSLRVSYEKEFAHRMTAKGRSRVQPVSSKQMSGPSLLVEFIVVRCQQKNERTFVIFSGASAAE